MSFNPRHAGVRIRGSRSRSSWSSTANPNRRQSNSITGCNICVRLYDRHPKSYQSIDFRIETLDQAGSSGCSLALALYGGAVRLSDIEEDISSSGFDWLSALRQWKRRSAKRGGEYGPNRVSVEKRLPRTFTVFMWPKKSSRSDYSSVYNPPPRPLEFYVVEVTNGANEIRWPENERQQCKPQCGQI